MSTPKEVFSALAADFRRRNLNYSDVAELTGYKKQTIANIISSRKDYLSEGQAARFSQALGYSMDFLLSGTGYLTQDESSIVSLLNMLSRNIRDQEKILKLLAKEYGVAFQDDTE